MNKPKLPTKGKLLLTALISIFGLLFIGCMILLSTIITSLLVLFISIIIVFVLIMALYTSIASIVFKDYITKFNEEE